MMDGSRFDRGSKVIGALSDPDTSEPIPTAVSEYADQYNLNDIGLAMRLYESRRGISGRPYRTTSTWASNR